MIRILDGKKLRAARGARSRQEIADASGKTFSIQQIYNYEHGLSLPRPQRQPALLAALGVEFDEVSSPIKQKPTPKSLKRRKAAIAP